MKKRRNVTLLIVLATVIFLMTGCGSDTKKIENRLDNIEKELNTTELQEKLDSIESKIDSSNQEAKTETETQKKLQEANKTIEELQQQIDSNSSSSGYEQIKFWQDGKVYTPRDDIQFYSDCFCSQTISGVQIISPIEDEMTLSNNLTVYAVLSDKGIIYSTEKPRLREVEQ